MPTGVLSPILAHLNRTPRTIRVLLGGLPDDLCKTNYGRDTFSPFDVVGHLIWGDLTDWVPRAMHILEHGNSVGPWEAYLGILTK